MARTLTSAVATAAQAALVRPVLLLQVTFPTGTLRLWTGVGSLVYGGNTYTGAGSLISVSPIEETNEVRAAGVQVTLSGIPSNTLATAVGTMNSGQSGEIRFGLMDSANALIADPVLAFAGRLDTAVIEESGDTCTVLVTFESRLIDLERPRERRYTDEDQQAEFSGDVGMQYVAALQDRVLKWGTA